MLTFQRVGLHVVLAILTIKNGCQAGNLKELLDTEDSDVGAIDYNRLHQILVFNQRKFSSDRAIKSLSSRLRVLSLNGVYDFCFDPKRAGFREQWFSNSLSEYCMTGDFYRIPVPSAFNDIMTNTTAKNYMGWFWYQTKISIDRLKSLHDDDGQLVLQLESINYLALIYVQRLPSDKDAKLVGSHVGGHLPIKINLDGFIQNVDHSDKIGYLRITIAVSNMLTYDTIPSGRMIDLSSVVGREYKQFQPDFDFFHFAGILGDINMISLPACYIENIMQTYKTRLNAINLAQSQFEVTLRFYVPEALRYLRLRYRLIVGEETLLEDDWKLFAKIEDELVDWRTQGKTFNTLTTHISFNENFLKVDCRTYRKQNKLPVLIVDLVYGHFSKVVDSFESPIAWPEQHIAWTKLDLHGFGMHQEQLFSGRSVSLPAIMKDMYLLKQIGANVIRTSHYPYSPQYLSACDEHGIMVIAECPAVGLKSFSDTKLLLHKQILQEMMWRDHHHPSIIMWSVANEPESQHEEARIYFESLLEYARNELAQYTVNATRPLTAAIAQSHSADRIGHLLDVIMINRYYAWYDYTDALETIRPALLASLSGWARKHPDKPLMISEFGADALPGMHRATRGVYTEEFQRDLISEYEKVFIELRQANSSIKASSEIENFIGSMIWNFADFTTHESLGRIGGLNRKGIFTREREPKLAVKTVRESYTKRATNCGSICATFST